MDNWKSAYSPTPAAPVQKGVNPPDRLDLEPLAPRELLKSVYYTAVSRILQVRSGK